jgi:hypothetical protein
MIANGDIEKDRLSRRRLLRRGSAAAGALIAPRFLGRALGFSSPGPARTAKITRFGFTTYQWGKDWDVPALIDNCRKAGVFGLELRTSAGYAHAVELDTNAEKRREVKKRFADSAVILVGLASGERFDSPDPARLKEAIENSKGFIKLSHDVGGSGIRVFPNDFHKDVPRERTIEQIAGALNQVGAFARDYSQQVRLEAHGSAGALTTLRSIMDRVTQPAVRVKLNSMPRDAEGEGFEANFNLVKPFLGDTLHLHELDQPGFPFQLQMDLLVKMGWTGWQLVEASAKVPDRLKALIAQREMWERLLARAQGRG